MASFAFPTVLGIVLAALSSIWIAAPILFVVGVWRALRKLALNGVPMAWRFLSPCQHPL